MTQDTDDSGIVTNDESDIQEFYRGATVFITGGTGFMGRVLTEKLLRCCPDVDEIILLVRSKRNKSCYERLDDIFDEVLFKRVSMKSRHKVSVVNGDCMLPGLGLSDSDRTVLAHKVDVVFHAAATVRFDEPLPQAVAINVHGTKAMLDLARQMMKLKAFIHVSTAYSNCHEPEIEEKFYPPHYNGDKLIKMVDCLEKPLMDQLTPTLLKDVPNTYVYTKCIAEDLIKNYSKGLPVAVFRPSIIVATKQDPLPGWVDNLLGATGIIISSGMGLMRSIHCRGHCAADIVPVDMVINALMAAAWQVHRNHSVQSESTYVPKVYNFVSSPERPINWATFVNLSFKHWKGTVNAVWYPTLALRRTALMQTLQQFLQLTLPACFIDIAARLVGKQPNMLKLSQKMKKFTYLTSHFTSHQWKFHNDNVRLLWESLSSTDRQTFPFSFVDLNWDNYFRDYMLGARQYVLKEDPSSIDKAQAWNRKLYWISMLVNSATAYFVLKITWILIQRYIFIRIHKNFRKNL